MSRLDGIALHEDFAVTQEMVIDHAGSDHGDDDPVVADDAAADGFGEGELVRFVEDGEVEGFARLHARGDDVRRLVGGKDEPHPGVAGGEKLAHPRAVGGDGKVEVAGAQDDFVAPRLHGGIGADAQMRQRRP